MSSVSPIAQYLRVNKAISVRDGSGCHFISPQGLYLGRLTKTVVNNYRIISIETFGEGFKKMYTKSIAIGQQFAYIKNITSPIGLSLVPIRTYMRKIFVDLIEKKSNTEDCEKYLTNELDLIAIDKRTQVGLFDTEKPFNYNTEIKNYKTDKLKHVKINYTKN